MKTKALALAGAAAAAPVDGLVKHEAARFVGCSVRQIERLAKAGHVRKKVMPKRAGDRVAPVIYSRADLERVKHGEIRAKPDSVGSGSNRPIVKNAGGADLLLRLLSAPPALPPDYIPWLTIKEFSKLSGLPPGFLRARAPELVGLGVAVNVAGAGRPRWRLLRAALSFPVWGLAASGS